MKEINIYTDGGCEPNPGVGGWAAILEYKGIEKEISGGQVFCTNNIMELVSVIEALKCIKEEKCKINIFTDSEYVKNGITKWINGWKQNNWKTKNKSTVKNKELWEELDSLSSKHEIDWNWVPGHSGVRLNEKCDQLASAAIKEIILRDPDFCDLSEHKKHYYEKKF